MYIGNGEETQSRRLARALQRGLERASTPPRFHPICGTSAIVSGSRRFRLLT
jgi:hypothetical protein